MTHAAFGSTIGRTNCWVGPRDRATWTVTCAAADVRIWDAIQTRGTRERIELLDQTAALDRFLAGVERRAYRMARIATGDEQEALDLVQEAMLRLVQRYRDRPEAEWAPLFHRILQSRIRDWYRRTRVRLWWRRWLPTDDNGGEKTEDLIATAPDLGTPSPDRSLANRRAMAALDTALRELPIRQQQAFLLRAWEELDVAQTAAAMGCSEGSVKTHYSRAVHALRKKLGAHWE